MPIIESILDLIAEHKVIHNCEGQPYLHRWFLIRRERIALFAHKFVRSDEERALHDHPWDFLVIPIWRGYIEHSERIESHDEYMDRTQRHPNDFRIKIVPVARRVWPILGIRFRRGEYRHRVELIGGKPSWSLFFRFRKRREWGFWPKAGFIAAATWWKNNCE